MSPSPPRPRRPLSQRGGPIETTGAEELAAPLARALAAGEDDDAFDLTHGFHVYLARMHPRIARELIAQYTEPGDVVLDPFCGSGTVLVEALVAGCRAQGVDLNPYALRISELHCDPPPHKGRERFLRFLSQVAAASEERVRTRERANIPISKTESPNYDVHVLLELSGLWEEISHVPLEAHRRALEMVFSAIVVKFSKQRAETSEDEAPRRIRKGLVTEFFVRKGQELCMRWEALEDALPEGHAKVRLEKGDARKLPELLGPRFRADFVLSSPPYGGTYDYAAHHARRNAWLQLDDRALRQHEIGARRNLSEVASGPTRWDRELLAVLRSIEAVLAPEGRVVLWMGDAEVSGHRVPADAQVARLAARAGLSLVASAAQPRADFHARGSGEPRKEHLLLLARSPGAGRS